MDFGATNLFLIIVLFWIVIGGGVGAVIGSQTGRGGLGFVLGLFGGFIGWIVMLLLPPAPEYVARQPVPGMAITRGEMYRECPSCKELMRRDARVCPHCRTESEPWTLHEGRWWVTRGEVSYYLDPQLQQWVRYEPTQPTPPPTV
jgi:hypothetical protein